MLKWDQSIGITFSDATWFAPVFVGYTAISPRIAETPISQVPTHSSAQNEHIPDGAILSLRMSVSLNADANFGL